MEEVQECVEENWEQWNEVGLVDCILNITKSQFGKVKNKKDWKDEMTVVLPESILVCPEFTDLFPDVMGYLHLIGWQKTH